MNNYSRIAGIGLALFTIFGASGTHAQVAADQAGFQTNWAQWRGPDFNGTAPRGNPPVEFSESTNIKWKTEIPGKGHATPVIWGNQIIILTAVPTDRKADRPEPAGQGERRGPPAAQTDLIHRFVVLSVDRTSGAIQWETTVREELPLEGTHNLGSWASNSPVTDGELIYAFFGSRGLYCLDFEGNILWEKHFGQMKITMDFGEGASPTVYRDRVIMVWDEEGQSFITTLDRRTGQEIWRVNRDEVTSWSTPRVIEVNGRAQIITSATNRIRSYDLETGDLIWECAGMTRNVIPSPVYAEGIVYLMSGFRGNALLAIDLARAKGDITNTDVILWRYDQFAPYTPSPVLMDGKLYFLRANNPELTCLSARDGQIHYSMQKVPGFVNIYSSPTGVADRLYMASEGAVVVVKAGPEFRVLATNKLDDYFHASPVIIGDELYIRGFRYLYCFAE